MNHQVPPARPHQKLTEDGRRMREVLSYSRRGSRFTPSQQQAWDAHAEHWVIPDEEVDQPGFDLTEAFGRTAPLVVEIALEVWRPGVAASLAEVAAAGADNVRFCSVDAVWSLEHLVAPAGLEELWTFFPDPWPKARHHKRRLVQPEFAALVASRLRPGGVWRLATDWAPYAEHMLETLDAEPGLEGGRVERWSDRPVTKFERKGLAVGREITDLLYRRV